MKRIFVAIDISENARRHVADRIAALEAEASTAAVKWVKTEKLHITIRFLGAVDEERLSAVASAVEKASREIKAFNLRLEDAGVFPSPKKARVLWIGVRDEQGMSGRSRDLLEPEFIRLGFHGDGKPFKPHLTIARLKDPRLAGPIIDSHLNEKFEPVEFAVGKIVIYESKLLPAGSVYSKFAEFDLGTQPKNLTG